LFNYLVVDLGHGDGLGKSATVGIQTSDSGAAQFSHNEAKLTNNMALRFVRMP